MSKPYWSGQGGRTGSSYVDDYDEAPTSRLSSHDSGSYNSGFYSSGGYRSTDEYRSTFESADDYDEDYDDYEYYERDLRWRWVAGLAVAVLVVAVIAITMVMRGDSPSPTASEAPATSTTPRTVIATIPPSPAAPPPAQLSPETVVTITTTPSAVAPPPVEVAPPPAPAVVPPPAAAPAGRTVTYTVTGTRQMIDLVSVIYTDEQGLPRTDINVTLPWTRTVVLNPGVDFESVTATSVTGQLNCAITDDAGATLIAQNNNSMITTCTG